MIKKAFLETMFKGFSIQSWNDKIRPVVLTEIDKNAHKMVIAYCLAKCEPTATTDTFLKIIKGGIFEYLRRIIISDIKSPVYRRIKKNAKAFESLNKWVFKQWKNLIDEGDFKNEFKKYLEDESSILDPLSIKILAAAHIYASYWEFKIIKQTNPDGYQIKEIDKLFMDDIARHVDLKGIQRLATKQKPTDFIDLAGQLRFQIRWSQTPRLPETSVLGHCMFVAVIAYMFSTQFHACTQRAINNFFAGLFHDLPEALTRDIISPVKMSTPEMPGLIKKIEQELAEEELYKTIDDSWKTEIKYYISDDDKSRILIGNKVEFVTTEIISEKYNSDDKNPIDGEIVKACDQLAAFIEVYMAKITGIETEELKNGAATLKRSNADRTIAGINFGAIYADFNL